MPTVTVSTSVVLLIQRRHLTWGLAYLGSFDVVMEVVTEGLDVGDVLGAPLLCEMAREKHYLASFSQRDTAPQEG